MKIPKVVSKLIVFLIFVGIIIVFLVPSRTSHYFSNLDNSSSSGNGTQKSVPDVKSKEGVPILMYHYIEEGENSLYVSPSDFEAQMDYLNSKGYETLNLEDLFVKQPDKTFVITFDDGYKDVIENAYPILEKYGFKATVFIIVNDIGKNRYLTWEDIKYLESFGWTIGSHTLNHKDLTRMSQKAAEQEITSSKKKLESKLDKIVDFFCYPLGKFNKDIIEIIRNAGYKAAVATLSGKDNLISDTYQLKRIRISKSTTMELFKEKLGIPQ